MSDHPLRLIFEPKSVGVVGASSDPQKRGHQVVAALQRSGFSGPIHPVNPKGGEIRGLPVARSIAEIDVPPDLVYVATPAAAVPDVVAGCGTAGVGGAIVPAVGFRESGPDGALLEARLLAAARETGIRVVGPNTSGLLNTHIGLHMVGGEPLAAGGLAIVSQSGNVALDLMTSAAARPLGVSIYVGPGNETDVGFHEILEYLAGHEPTRAIVMYMEGVQHGSDLYRVVKCVSKVKPVVVLKGGRSDAGTRSARSHTGSVAGSYRVFRAAARQSGMIEVDGSDELYAVGETLALQPVPARLGSAGAGFVVLSDGGGHATIAADRFVRLGVPLARLAAETQAQLRALLGPAASVRNPVDAAGAPDSAPSVLVRAVEIASADPACAGILLSGLFGGYAIRFAESLESEERAAANGLAEAVARAGIPLVVHSLYERRAPAPLRRLLEAGVPVYGSLELAATCCAALCRRVRASTPSPGSARQGDGDPPVSDARPASSVPAEPGALEESGAGAVSVDWLSEVETRELVARNGVTVVDGVFCRSEGDVEQATRALPGPWAVKAVSKALQHKTEAGAVRLGCEDLEAVERAYRECTAAARAYLGSPVHPGGRRASAESDPVEGALLTRMLPSPVAELLIGGRRDAAFGPILTVGFGGVDVELAPDISIRVLPVSADEVVEMWSELGRSPVLFGHRGSPGVDLDGLVSTALAVGRCLLDDPMLAEVELNPVFAYPDRCVAIDAIARLAGSAGS
ncbi:MAG: acetate--CoA ligase family protein [Gemmatimonadota bacterium]